MKVRMGWSTDYAKNKFDVELEQSDLENLLEEEGLADAKLTVMELSGLLKAEAEVVCAAAAHGYFPSAADKMIAAKAVKAQRLAAIHQRQATLKKQSGVSD